MTTLPKIFIYKRERFLNKIESDKLRSLLTLEEKNKINRFKNRMDAENFLIARVMRRKLIASLIGIAPKKLIFGTNKYGRPFLKFPRIKNFDFNLSHSEDYIVLAIADCPIGIDIEKIKPLDIKIAIDYFTEQELKYLDSYPVKRLERFHELWVLKESFIKAIGRGLSFPLKKINFECSKGRNIILRPKSAKGKWFFRIYEIDKNYKMAVCSNKNKFPKKINFTNKNLMQLI